MSEIATLKFRVKLCAYTKGIVPTHPVADVENVDGDNQSYVRKYNNWITLDDALVERIPETSGLTFITDPESNLKNIIINQWTGLESDLPETLEDNKIYYTDET